MFKNLKLQCCFFLLLFAFATQEVRGADLYAILLADTYAENIGDANQITVNKFQKTMNRICHHTGLSLKQEMFLGEDLCVQSLLERVKALPIKSEDVVIFFFTGHGFNFKAKQSEWPHMYFTKENTGLDQVQITKVIMGKKPRLLISISDSCNNFINVSGFSIDPHHFYQAWGMGKTVNFGYQKLFLKSSGVILISGAKTGEFAFSNFKNGACFTNAFIEALDNEVLHGEGADWSHLLELATQKLIPLEQYPQYKVIPDGKLK